VFRLRHVDVRRADQVRVVVETTVQIEGAPRPAAIADWVLPFVLHEVGDERMLDGPGSRVAGAVRG